MKHPWIALSFCFASALTAQTVAPAPSVFRQPSAVTSSPELASLMQQPEEVVTLRTHDLVMVETYHADALNRTTRIDVDGTINLPIIGQVKLEGLTTSQASQMLAALYTAQNLVLNPLVSVTVLESPSRVITVSGEVANPGLYPVIGSNGRKDSGTQAVGGGPVNSIQTLSQLISAAGGLKDSASNVITLIRPSLHMPLTIVLGPDPTHNEYGGLRVFAGDELRVSRVGSAYVIGAVKKQGAIPLKNFSPTTVAEAVSMSDGIGYEASADDAQIVRTQGTGRVSFKVPVHKILEGKAADIPLQNDDILYIPTSKTKAAIKGGATGFIVSLASTYIYAHP